MECIKTGCLAYLDSYGEVVRGDLFAFEDVADNSVERVRVVMRVCERDCGGTSAHAWIASIEEWFDEHKTSGGQNSTLIGWMTRFNYEGL